MKRSSIEIIAEVLRLGENGAGKTRIMYGANMSHGQLNRYIDFLMSHGFLEQNSSENCKVRAKYYTTTEKGKRLLKNIDKIGTLLGIEDWAIGGK